MTTMKKLIIILLTSLISNIAWPHGGGLNKDGCHNERKTGGYHCHRGNSPVTPNMPKQKTNIDSEKSINTKWCASRGGIAEFRTQYGTFVDCLTEDYAVEAEYDTNWKEAIGQSLHYAEATGKLPAILLIKQRNSKKDYLFELNRVIGQYELPIRVFEIGE